MIRRSTIRWIFATHSLLLYSLALPVSAKRTECNFQEIADQILQTYRSRWSELTVDKQKHFALRMYRVTGDTLWLPAIRTDLQNTITNLRSDADSLGDSAYYRRRIESLAEGMDWGVRKNEARRLLFDGRDGMLLQLNLLYDLATVDDYQPSESLISQIDSRIRSMIRPKAIADFLTDSSTIISYGPQAANAVEYLHQLSLIDIRHDYQNAFRCAFPDSNDKKLDDRQFGDKVYGLTHMVIAASGYYQHMVDPGDFRWALAYFREQQNRILKRLTADIIAEVGICFLLCSDSSDRIVDRCRQAVAKRFDRKAGLIVSAIQSSDIVTGEHRNILAYMLLRWPMRLHSGPTLNLSDPH